MSTWVILVVAAAIISVLFAGMAYVSIMHRRRLRGVYGRIIRVLEVHGDLPGMEIARLTGISRGTVYIYLTHLEEDGVVVSHPLPSGVTSNLIAGRVIHRRFYSLKR